MLDLLYFIILTAVIVFALVAVTYLLNFPTNDYEKHSAYECGFEPFGDARSVFDIHFYTIGLLFIVFDLEIVFLIPFAVDIEKTSVFGFINFSIFMTILLIGFFYEWSLGLLNWVPKKKFKF